MGLQSAINFPVYELVVPELTPRWVSMIIGEVGKPPFGITLSFGWVDDRAERWVDVTTGVRQGKPPGNWSRSDWDRYDSGRELLTRTDIDYRSAEGQAWRAAADTFNADYAAHYRSWTRQAWTIDGQSVEALSFEINGTWAALYLSPDRLVIYAYGRGVAPADLVLQNTDGTRYGVDWREPLHFPDSIKTSRALARER
jgi:hypothetical protein